MKYLLYYPFIFSFILIAMGSIYFVRKDKKIWLILAGIFSITITGGAVFFLLDNIGKNVALHKFNFFGLRVSLVAGIIVGLFGVVIWLWKKEKLPGITLAVLSSFYVFIYLMLGLYFVR